jgi:hypothetical protein
MPIITTLYTRAMDAPAAGGRLKDPGQPRDLQFCEPFLEMPRLFVYWNSCLRSLSFSSNPAICWVNCGGKGGVAPD